MCAKSFAVHGNAYEEGGDRARTCHFLLEEDRELWAIASLHQEQEQESRNYLSYLQWFFLYTVFIFILGMYTGYKYRIRLSILVRTAMRFFRQEITMEFQRQQDERLFREGILQEARSF